MPTHLVLRYLMDLLQCNTSKPLLEEAAEIQDSGRKHKLSEFFGEFQLLNKRYHLTLRS